MSIADKITRLTAARDGIRTALANKGVSAGAHGFESFAADIGSIQTGITPSGTKSITVNGTYDVTEFASAAVDVDHVGTVKHYGANIPTAVIGVGAYATLITGSSLLASIRSRRDLVIIYKTSAFDAAVAGQVRRGAATNELYSTPLPAPSTTYQAVTRINTDGTSATQTVTHAINDDTDISSGNGRVHITASGDLRIYSNTNGYQIPAGKIDIYVIWGDD